MKSHPVSSPAPQAAETHNFGDVCILAISTATFKALSDAAQARNLTVAELLSRAIDSFITETK